jgi:Family of unknown function (DUF6868)
LQAGKIDADLQFSTFNIQGTAVNPDIIKELLLYSLAFNYAILIIWFGVFSLAHDWMYRLHCQWFRLSAETFDTLHYVSMALYKIGIIILNIAPLVALWLVF